MLENLEQPNHTTEPTADGWIIHRTVKVYAVRRHHMVYSEYWRDMSVLMHRQDYNRCCRCQKEFQDGEPMDTVFLENDTPRWVCASCGDAMAQMVFEKFTAEKPQSLEEQGIHPQEEPHAA